MQLPTSDWKAPHNIETAKKKGASHPGPKNYINLVHSPHAKPE